jgi:hypothetical protein
MSGYYSLVVVPCAFVRPTGLSNLCIVRQRGVLVLASAVLVAAAPHALCRVAMGYGLWQAGRHSSLRPLTL